MATAKALGSRRSGHGATTEGERWTRAVLAELRAGEYRPGAWARFVARSHERARERRRDRARAFRQLLAVGAVGTVPWLALGVAGRPLLALAGVLWWLAVLVMLDWHLGLVERPDGSAVEGIGAANLVTLARAAAVPALPALPPDVLAGTLLLAGASDVLDGWVARRRNAPTRLGAWLDPASDALVYSVASVVLAGTGLLPAWAAGLVILRFALPAFAIVLVYFATTRPPPRAAHLPGRVPGLVLLAGLVLAGLALPAAVPLAALGALGGLATFGATVVRTRRSPRALA